MRYLFIAFHYPKPEYRQDLLRWISRVGAALRAQPGLLQLGDFEDAVNGRIVAVSVWESADHLRTARELTFASLGAGALYEVWETRLPEVFTLGELEETAAASESDQ
ncbi:MAG TPA: antibiotic biosynthesis monooxygenase [Ktedonobacterales bacterium]|nr:antibiotic biosynthesis monooxygenase [Ktedonobacterales bacterium]